MIRFIIIISVLFFGCSVNRNVAKNIEILETTKTRVIDTTLHFLNPLEYQVKSTSIDDTLVIDNKFYRVVSFINQKTKQLTTQFEPKQKAKIEIKVKDIETKKETTISKQTETKILNWFDNWLNGFLFVLGLTFCFGCYKLIKKYLL